MKHVTFEHYSFSDLHEFRDSEWEELRQSLIGILRWISKETLQLADAKDLAQAVILGLIKSVEHSFIQPNRENRPLKGYVFKAARNAWFSYLRRARSSRECLAEDHDIDINEHVSSLPDLDWVSEEFDALNPNYRVRLEEDVFENENILAAAGSTKDASKFYKRSFDARVKLRVRLLKERSKLGIHIRGLDSDVGHLQEAA
jgi:DNA-directed RNA polymerase specialized sigma24 family protein